MMHFESSWSVYIYIYIHIIFSELYVQRSQDAFMNMFAFTNIRIYYLVTTGETDQMKKHHAADCQDPEDAAATSDPFGGNKVYVG